PVGARRGEREGAAPAVPPRRRARARQDHIAALRAGGGVDVQRGEVVFRTLNGSHGTGAAVVQRAPQPVDRAVISVWKELGAPVPLRVQRRGEAREQRGGGACGSQRGARTRPPCPCCYDTP